MQSPLNFYDLIDVGDGVCNAGAAATSQTPASIE